MLKKLIHFRNKIFLSFLITLLINNPSLAFAKSVASAVAKVVKNQTSITGEVVFFGFEYSKDFKDQGNEFGISPAEKDIEQPYKISGEANTVIKFRMLDSEGKESSEKESYLPIELKNEKGEIIKAKVLFSEEELFFDQKGKANIQTKIELIEKKYTPKTTYKASYYLELQN